MTFKLTTVLFEGRCRFDAFLAAPGGRAKTVAVLLLPEMFGLTPAMCEAAGRFAEAGYATAVPNIFWRDPFPGVLAYEGADRQSAWERLQRFDGDAAMGDIAAAAGWLAAKSGADRIAAVGHCLGGRLAVRALNGSPLVGAVSYYGLGISKMGPALAILGKPAQLHYGLADEHVPQSEVDAVTVLAARNANVEIFRYEGAGHSFCNPYRPMFAPDAATLVHQRTLAFFERLATSPDR
jgi:carboxymethylenebutenolidase